MVEVAHGGLDRGLAERELELFKITVVLAPEFVAAETQIMSNEAHDANMRARGPSTLHVAESLSASPPRISVFGANP